MLQFRFFNIVLALACVALAIFVGITSFAITNQTREPALTLATGVFPQGLAQANQAQNMLATKMVKNPQAGPSRSELGLARQALAREPLAAAAVPIIARGMALEQQQAASERLLILGGKMTRRNVAVNSMLVEQHLRRGDESAAITSLSRVVATSNEARSLYMRQLAAATASPRAGAALAPLLGRNPLWAESYWNEVLELGPAIVEGGKLRTFIAGPPWKLQTVSKNDLRLIEALAARGEFDLANGLATSLGFQRPSGRSAIVNGSFSRAPRFAPFDWEQISTGEFDARIEPGERRMLVSSLSAASGAVARQALFLTPGQYRLSWRSSGETSPDSEPLRFRLVCALGGKGDLPIPPINLSLGSGRRAVNLPASPCRWFWAQVEVDTMQSDAGVDLVIHELNFERTGADDAPAPTTSSTETPKNSGTPDDE